MEFGIKKWVVIIMNRGIVKSTDGIELTSGEKIREIEEGVHKYVRILEYDRIKEQEMKVKFRNEYFRRAKLILKSKLNGRNKIMALDTWAVSISLGWYVKNNVEPLLVAVRTNRTITNEGTVHPKKFKKTK